MKRATDARERNDEWEMTMARTIELIDANVVTPNSGQTCGCDSENVASLVAAIRSGKTLPPAIVVREWMEVRDGCHRLAAAKATGTKLAVIFISREEYAELREDGITDCDLTDEIA